MRGGGEQLAEPLACFHEWKARGELLPGDQEVMLECSKVQKPREATLFPGSPCPHLVPGLLILSTTMQRGTEPSSQRAGPLGPPHYPWAHQSTARKSSLASQCSGTKGLPAVSIRAFVYETGFSPKPISMSRSCTQSIPRWGPARP